MNEWMSDMGIMMNEYSMPIYTVISKKGIGM